MPKKTFSIAPPRDDEAEAAETAAVDLQILEKTVDDGVRGLEGARMIALDRLRPDPAQPRRDFDPRALDELAASIRAHGVLQPLLVRYRYEEDDFMIIAGERRYRASQLAGLTEAPALIRNIGGTQRYVLQLIENLQREDLNPVDKGRALDHLKTIMPGNWQQMADLVGLTRRRVEQLRALPRLPASLQEAVRANRITEDHARTIVRLPEEYQVPALAAVEKGGLSTRRAKALVQRIQESVPDTPAGAVGAAEDVVPAPDLIVRSVAEALLRSEGARGPRSKMAVPVYEKALEFERVLDRMPVLEFQEDRTLLSQIFARIEDKIGRIRGEEL
jgi:ParB family chromosome partitioning protein